MRVRAGGGVIACWDGADGLSDGCAIRGFYRRDGFFVTDFLGLKFSRSHIEDNLRNGELPVLFEVRKPVLDVITCSGRGIFCAAGWYGVS